MFDSKPKKVRNKNNIKAWKSYQAYLQGNVLKMEPLGVEPVTKKEEEITIITEAFNKSYAV